MIGRDGPVCLQTGRL